MCDWTLDNRPAAQGIRTTKDVDVITEVASYAEYSMLSERLRALGLSEDDTEGAPVCRWRHKKNLIVDIMPAEESVLGFTNRWYRPAVESAWVAEIAGLRVRVITPVYFLATKLDAFNGRGNNDYGGSHDLEDVVAVVDGRPEIVREVRDAPEDVRVYIASETRRLLETRQFVDALPGMLLPDSASQARLPVLR